MRFRLLVLALGTFAIGKGSFVFAGPLEGVARDLSVAPCTRNVALSLNASAIYLGRGPVLESAA